MGFNLPRLGKFLPWTHHFGQESAEATAQLTGAPSPPEGGAPSGSPASPRKFGGPIAQEIRTILGTL